MSDTPTDPVVAKAIGSLTEKANQQAHQLRLVLDRMDDVQRLQNQALDLAKEALALAKSNNDTITEEIQPHIKSYVALRNRGLGALAVAGIAASAVTAWLHRKLPWLDG